MRQKTTTATGARAPGRRRWMSRAGPVVATIAALGLLAGCGSSDSGADAGSEAGASSGAGGASSEGAVDSDQALAFAECMRENGVPNFPDPVDGGFRITPDSGMRLGSEEFRQAREACQDEAPAGLPGGGGSPDPETEEAFLAFAQCMRDNGIDFPDPDLSGGGVMIQPGEGGADFDPNSPEFEAAQEECSQHLEGLPGGQFRGGAR